MIHTHLCVCGGRFSAAQPTLSNSATPYIMFKTRFSRKLAEALSEGVIFLIRKHKLAFGELGFISSSF